jgi:molybdopterin synthase sulfur carrier subunit
VPVEVRLPTQLRDATGGQATVPAAGETVAEVLADLTARFPGLAGRIITTDGALHKFVNVYLNDDDIRYLDRLGTKVGDGDQLSILPAVAGG